eukprot:7187843-Heterocapsa_arctica.AAC.1
MAYVNNTSDLYYNYCAPICGAPISPEPLHETGWDAISSVAPRICTLAADFLLSCIDYASNIYLRCYCQFPY